MTVLLSSLADVACRTFGAQSCSIAILDEGAHELVFTAVCGPDADELVGARFKTTDGIAGDVATSGRAVVVDDLGSDPHFSVDIATETGYLPSRIMVAPLRDGDGPVLGVISVLDREEGRNADEDLALLTAVARHAALAVALLDRARVAVGHAGELGALLR